MSDPDRLDGNLSWRIDTPKGPALQKLYCERGGRIAVHFRELFIALAGTKTSARARARRATERRLLALWREHGVVVPADWTDDLPQFAAPDVAILEFVEDAVPLWHLLARPDLGDARRAGVLRRFAAEWGLRHAEALRSGEAGLVQEHGTIRHVLVAGERLVWIDLEQAFRPRADLRPILAKEVAGFLRSLWKRVGEERFTGDLAEIAGAYGGEGGSRALLRAACDEYLRPRGLRRVLWSADRWRMSERQRRAKYGVLEALDLELRRRGD